MWTSVVECAKSPTLLEKEAIILATVRHPSVYTDLRSRASPSIPRPCFRYAAVQRVVYTIRRTPRGGLGVEGRPTELLVSLHHTPKSTGGVRRIVYAMRSTAAHLKHVCCMEGDGVGEKCVWTKGWRAVARMIASFSRFVLNFLDVSLVLLYVETNFCMCEPSWWR